MGVSKPRNKFDTWRRRRRGTERVNVPRVLSCMFSADCATRQSCKGKQWTGPERTARAMRNYALRVERERQKQAESGVCADIAWIPSVARMKVVHTCTCCNCEPS
jgi:hypothetical protein